MIKQEKKIKILFLVTNLRDSDGVTHFVMSYFRAIDHNAMHIDFAVYKTVEKSFFNEITKTGSKIFILPPIMSFRKHVVKCKEIIEKGNYDIVHDNIIAKSNPLMHFANRMNVSVRLLHIHSTCFSNSFYKNILSKVAYMVLQKSITHYVACSSEAGKSILKDKKYIVIQNIISSDYFTYSQANRLNIRKKLGVNNKIVIASIGRICKSKKPFFSLKIIKSILKNKKNIEYWLIGNGPLADKLKKRVHSQKLDQYVRFWGSRNDMFDLYHAIDILLMPSAFEGLGIVALESQAMGIPTFVSDRVPREVQYTDLVEFIPLRYNPKHWADLIIDSFSKIPMRRNHSKDLLLSHFSDKNAGTNLYQTYLSMLYSSNPEQEVTG